MSAAALLFCLLAQDARPYRLPFEEGTSWIVGQGGMSNGTHRNKWAYDIMMPEGTKVFAARPGRVLAIKQDTPDPPPGKPGTGEPNWVVVDHGDGTEAQYVHIKQNSAVVKAGDKVEQGQLLCLSGNTGVSPVPHLHLECKRGPLSFEPAFEDVDGDGRLQQGMKATSGNIPGVPVDVKDRLSALSRAAKLAEQEGAWGLAYGAWKRFADEKLAVKYAKQDDARKRLDEIARRAAETEPSWHARLAFSGLPAKPFEQVRKPDGEGDAWETFLRALKAEIEGRFPAARTGYKGLLGGRPDDELRARAEARLKAVDLRLAELQKKAAAVTKR